MCQCFLSVCPVVRLGLKKKKTFLLLYGYRMVT